MVSCSHILATCKKGLNSILAGIYLVFFPGSLFVLFHHTRVKVNKLIFVAAWVLFASVTSV